jgi:hypothetical protein
MKASPGARAALICHPATPSTAVRSIELQVHATGQGALTLRYALEGQMNRLLIPARKTPRRADRLWQHTCFELFCTAGAGTAYYELNFSPSSEWAIYGFTGYREGMANLETQQAPHISVRAHATGLELEATVNLEALSELDGSPTLRAGAAAVIEEVDGALSYWALVHPGAKPDFHHAGAFALSIARSDI